ncbi:MAG: EAL domain-containing protein [Rhodoferax sp.]|nr:EAL domain-containing protein [Rhodoferax sp.]MDO8448181.1 EAL domain-containing protein [Rhodoferax sp.]
MEKSLERKRDSEELYRTTFEKASIGVSRLDLNGRWLQVNHKLCEITGYSENEMLGLTYEDITHPEDVSSEVAGTSALIMGEIENLEREKRYLRKGGKSVWVHLRTSLVRAASGEPKYLVAVTTDITERKKAEERINELAYFDQLTGLPNRTLLLDRLQQTMAASSRDGSYGALLFIDLDNFKTLNDTLGHDMGDLLLKQVAQRLASCVREGDSVARLGGDEFVLMLTRLSRLNNEAAASTEKVADKILATLNEIYQLGHVAHHSTPSIGVTLFKGQQVAIDELMKQADLAMYKAKAAGRNAVRFFDPAMEATVMVRAALEHDLRQAIEKKQFVLHYQAQVVGDGRVTGAEVLLRWQHPQRGMVSPAEFIPAAEETGLILPLGHWVQQTACTQLALWATRPEMAHLTVAVNVSAHQFRQADFVAQVLDVLKSTGADPRRLKLELTESLLVANVEDVIEKMFALKAKGVGFSLDDFGTGFSSLSYLKRLPLDQLKIDQSFVRDVLSDPNDAAIAKTVIALGQSLGLGVIAEGVETAAQRDFLSDAGCHAYQGYFFSRPLPLEGFEQLAQRV